MAKKFIPRATQFHERIGVYLNKLIMCGLYESLGIACRNLRAREDLNAKFMISYHMWFLQLWLNATFEPFVKINIAYDPKRRVKGLRLTKLTPDDVDGVSKEAFETYFNLFCKCKTFVCTMAHFHIRNHVSEWFKKSVTANMVHKCHVSKIRFSWSNTSSAKISNQMASRLGFGDQTQTHKVNHIFHEYQSQELGFCA